MARLKKDLTDGEKKELFLATLSDTAHITNAAKRAGLARRTAYNWRAADPAFAKGWEEAIELGAGALEDEAVRRAKDGTLKPVYQGGKKVGEVREYSDTLLIFLLKGCRPEKYKDRLYNEHAGVGGAEIVVKVLGPNQSMSDL